MYSFNFFNFKITPQIPDTIKHHEKDLREARERLENDQKTLKDLLTRAQARNFFSPKF